MTTAPFYLAQVVKTYIFRYLINFISYLLESCKEEESLMDQRAFFSSCPCLNVATLCASTEQGSPVFGLCAFTLALRIFGSKVPKPLSSIVLSSIRASLSYSNIWLITMPIETASIPVLSLMFLINSAFVSLFFMLSPITKKPPV